MRIAPYKKKIQLDRITIYLIITVCFLGLLPKTIKAQSKSNAVYFLKGVIKDSATRELLSFATLQLKSENHFKEATIANAQGAFSFSNVPQGKYILIIYYLGYITSKKVINLQKNAMLTLLLSPDVKQLGEVIVTATEKQGMTSVSRINKVAMEHLQPSSFADILSLLPGNSVKTPQMTSANVVRLREVGTTGSDYAVSSMGTQFVIDGAPLFTDANMQYVAQGYTNQDDSRSTVNYGVDMRSLSTDDIESVDVIRGIPSVIYGDLSSGVIRITRKLSPSPLQVRFKADQYSKLLHVNKGIAWKNGKNVLHLDLGLLDSYADPRNRYENYKRVMSSIRYKQRFKVRKRDSLYWKTNFDYTATIDQEKDDPDRQLHQADNYKSAYQSFRFNHQLIWKNGGKGLFRQFKLNANLSYSYDKITRNKFVQLTRDYAVPFQTTEGAHDAEILPYKYIAHLEVEGKPFTANIRTIAHLSYKTGLFKHKSLLGIEWRLSKNYGKGQVYNVKRPINPSTSLRPRTYASIPAKSIASFFVEDRINWSLKKHRFELLAGLRANTLLNLSSAYAMQRKVYLDPRINLQWKLPVFSVGNHPLRLNLTAGWGKLTLMPSLSQLYPEKAYIDLVQLNFYHPNASYRRINTYTYTLDRTPYQLKPATNRKLELRVGANYRNYNLSVTCFREKMSDGFRSMTQLNTYTYRKYDTSGIDRSILTAPPSITDLPYRTDTILGGYRKMENGSEIEKEGIEFQASTPRFKALKTRLTIAGAWLRTTYKNSRPMYYTSISTLVLGTPVTDKYVGYYNWNEGYAKERFNTNFTFDTYLKKIGLTLSTTFECMWMKSSQRLQKEGRPIAYMNYKGEFLPYTDKDAQDIYRKWLTIPYSDALFRRTTEPFYMYVNLKVSKEFGKWARIALFVDRILDYLPDYESAGYTIRRTVKPYFGMELKLKI